MKLDRNIPSNQGRGKYALLKLRNLPLYEPSRAFEPSPVYDAISLLEKEGLIEWGEPESENEFFVLKLKDLFAYDALNKYADSCRDFDPEFADEVRVMASRSGLLNKWCKQPD